MHTHKSTDFFPFQKLGDDICTIFFKKNCSLCQFYCGWFFGCQILDRNPVIWTILFGLNPNGRVSQCNPKHGQIFCPLSNKLYILMLLETYSWGLDFTAFHSIWYKVMGPKIPRPILQNTPHQIFRPLKGTPRREASWSRPARCGTSAAAPGPGRARCRAALGTRWGWCPSPSPPWRRRCCGPAPRLRSRNPAPARRAKIKAEHLDGHNEQKV